MKLQVTQENLSKALNSVAKVANTRSTLPVLANVLFKTVGNRLSIAGTNLDIAITHYIGSKVMEEGAITVPARLMQDFITSLPSSVISLELDENKLHIKTDKYQSTINGMSAEDFPVMPDISKGTEWNIPGKALKSALQQVVVAASTNETRPVLTGVFLHSHEGVLYAVATDSYRLAEKTLISTKEEIKLLVPASAMHDLLRILTDYEEDVQIVHNDQQILFKAGDVELVTRLIEGSYPDYRKLIPKEFKAKATLKRTELTNVTKVSSLFARESAGSITISLDEKKGELSVRSIASQLGENSSSADAKISGNGSITLNSKYLLDALNVFSGDNITLSFNGKLDPATLFDADNKDYLHVVMPLKS